MLRRSDLSAVTLLAAAVLLTYANSLGGAFQFDDYNVIVDNPVVHSWFAWWNDLGHGIRPLLKLSYLFNWLSGFGASGFHAVNLLIHFGNTLLVYHLAHCFLSGPIQTNDNRVPLIASLLFAVHPVHTEAVTYICGRSASLMTFFTLSCLLCHATANGKHERLKRLYLVPLLFSAALASKETAITLPLALLLWDLCGGIHWRRIISRQWPVWLLALGVILSLFYYPAYRDMLVKSAGLHSFATNALTTVYAFFYLLGKWLWPVQLNIDPELPIISAPREVIPQLSGAMILLITAWCSRHKRPCLTFAIGWLALQLTLIYLLVPRQDIANERQLYLAGFPLFIIAAAELVNRLQNQGQNVAIVTMVVCSLLTMQRNLTYENEISLWQDTIKLSPGKARAHNNLGYAYFLANRTAEARQQYMLALAIDAEFSLARGNLAILKQIQQPEQ